MATDEDRQHIQLRIKALSKRFKILELRKDRQGDAADPSVDLEIDELRLNIGELQRVLDGPKLHDETKQAIRKYYDDDIDFLIATTAGLNQRQTRTEEQVQSITETQHAAGLWRLGYGPIIDALSERATREDRDAPKGRRRTLILLLLIVLFIAAEFGSIVWLALKVHA